MRLINPFSANRIEQISGNTEKLGTFYCLTKVIEKMGSNKIKMKKFIWKLKVNWKLLAFILAENGLNVYFSTKKNRLRGYWCAKSQLFGFVDQLSSQKVTILYSIFRGFRIRNSSICAVHVSSNGSHFHCFPNEYTSTVPNSKQKNVLPKSEARNCIPTDS